MYEHIRRFLTAQDIDFTMHEHEPIRSVEDAQAHLPFPTDQLLKTLAFHVRDGGWILASLKGLDRLDYRRLAEAAGVSRAAVLGATPEEMVSVLGCEAGAVSPIPLNPDTTVLFDDTTATMDVIYTGSGRTDRTLEVRMADLLRVVSPRVVPLRRDGAGGA